MTCPEPGRVQTLNKFRFLPPAPGKSGLKVCTQETRSRLNLPQKEQMPPSLQPRLLGEELYPARPTGSLSEGLALLPNDLILRRAAAPPTCSSQQNKETGSPSPHNPHPSPAQPWHPEFSTSSFPALYQDLRIPKETAPNQKRQIRCAWIPLL